MVGGVVHFFWFLNESIHFSVVVGFCLVPLFLLFVCFFACLVVCNFARSLACLFIYLF